MIFPVHLFINFISTIFILKTIRLFQIFTNSYYCTNIIELFMSIFSQVQHRNTHTAINYSYNFYIFAFNQYYITIQISPSLKNKQPPFLNKRQTPSLKSFTLTPSYPICSTKPAQNPAKPPQKKDRHRSRPLDQKTARSRLPSPRG